jgi:hypothetical protein
MSSALALLAMVLLLSPSSSSVLCIAPGSHIAVEDVNSLCCVSHTVSPSTGLRPNGAFEGPGSCDNCTDVFLALNGNGVLSQSGSSAIAKPIDAEFLDASLSSDLSASLSRSAQTANPDAPVLLYPSIPLRC